MVRMGNICAQFVFFIVQFGFGGFSVGYELGFTLLIVDWPAVTVHFRLRGVILVLVQVFVVFFPPSFILNLIIITIGDFLTFTCAEIGDFSQLSNPIHILL